MLRKKKKDSLDASQGKYLSRYESGALERLQRRKSIFTLLSTLLFGVSLFLPVEGRNLLFPAGGGYLWLQSLYVGFLAGMIGYSVFISYQNFRGHKIRSEIPQNRAPRGGFDKHTYWTFEIFNALHVLLCVVETTVSCLQIGLWGAFNIAAVTGSMVLSMLARFVLYRAYAGNVDYLPPRAPEPSASPLPDPQADDPADEFYTVPAAESEAESFADDENPADEFYTPPDDRKD